MFSNRKWMLVTLAVAAAMLLGSCGPAATPEPQLPDLGSPERPIHVYFVPSAEIDRIIAGGDVLKQALEEATGLSFEVFVPTSYAAAIEGMCASPGDTMGFPATLAYVIANARCGVDVSRMSVRFGWDVYWAQYLVRRDSGITTFADLNGKKWGATDATSTSGYMIPLIELGSAGITPSETVFTGGHAQSVLAVLNGDVDFGTSYYTPPTADGFSWAPGDAPEPWLEILEECNVDAEGAKMFCGEYRVRDARSASGVRSVAPTVVKDTAVLALSATIPNDCLAFGPDFPADLRAMIEAALDAMQGSDAWNASLGDFYSWSEMRVATDSEYDVVRNMITGAGYSMDDMVGILEGK